MFAMYIRGFVLRMTKYGRYTDLLAGVVMLGLAFWWKSPWTAFFGVLSILSYVTDFNGWIQRTTMRIAVNKAAARRGARR